jgi:FkbM family methyltransferase
MMQMRMKAKKWIRRYPQLRYILSLIYSRMLHLRWLARNLLTGYRPITLKVVEQRIRLYPHGAIPEALYTNNFEAVERDFVIAFLKPGMAVVDAGANVGFYTLISSVLVGMDGWVHAFEPGRLTFELLQKNLELNKCQNVVANRSALFSMRKRMVLRVDPVHPRLDGHRFIQSMESITCPDPRDEIVECQTLDNYFLPLGKTVDFMKVDVEGAELALLQGAEKILARSPNITILLECTQNRELVRGFASRYGFKCFIWDYKGRVLKPAVYDEIIITGSVILRRQAWMGI